MRTESHLQTSCFGIFINLTGLTWMTVENWAVEWSRKVVLVAVLVVPVLWELHWLPVWQRVKFRTAVLVFKCLHDLAPAYLADYCQPTTVTAGRTRLRFANTQQLAVQRTNAGYGDRSFAVSGPSVWNSLPTALRMSDCSLTTFRTQLTTLLFIWYIV